MSVASFTAGLGPNLSAAQSWRPECQCLESSEATDLCVKSKFASIGLAGFYLWYTMTITILRSRRVLPWDTQV